MDQKVARQEPSLQTNILVLISAIILIVPCVYFGPEFFKITVTIPNMNDGVKAAFYLVGLFFGILGTAAAYVGIAAIARIAKRKV